MPTRSVPRPIAGGVQGGRLSLATAAGVRHQDVHQEASPALSTWGPGIAYSRLLRLKSGPGVELPSLVVECELCFAWEMEDDRTFVFYLRDEVRWQDLGPVKGRPLVADDLVFSYTRQRQAEFPNAGLLQGVKDMAAIGPGVVRFSLTVPDADFLLSLADGRSKVVAREAVELSGDLKNGPTIGSGPWVLMESVPDSAHIFDRNPTYFEQGLPFVDRLVIQVIPDRTTRDVAFRVGAIDVHEMSPRAWSRLRQERPDIEALMTPNPGGGLEVALNAGRPPFEDVRVRRAVFQAMDPWRAIEDIWLGSAFVSLGFPPVEPAWLLDEADLMGFFGRPEVARELLREADVKAPVPITIKVGDFGDAYLAHARRIADEMAAVGFAPVLETVNRLSFADDVWLGGDYQMFVGPIAPLTTPNAYLLNILHSRGRWNTTGHDDDELDRLIMAQARELDPVERGKLAREVQLRALEGAYRFMPATQSLIWVWRPRIRNFHPNFAAFEYSHWSRVWIEE
ncbi:MAG: ABC transporter substrate-binding protein [Chloroflexi bacterium]|nr:ABC transporter substrate-binding protein [Chloroflexota bacterium]